MRIGGSFAYAMAADLHSDLSTTKGFTDGELKDWILSFTIEECFEHRRNACSDS